MVIECMNMFNEHIRESKIRFPWSVDLIEDFVVEKHTVIHYFIMHVGLGVSEISPHIHIYCLNFAVGVDG